MVVILVGLLAVFSIVTAVTGNWLSGLVVAGIVAGLVRSGRREVLRREQEQARYAVVRIDNEQPDRWWRW